MFGGRRRADNASPDVFRYLRRGNAHTATCRMDKNRLTPLQPAHDDDKLPPGEIIDWDSCSFECRHALRACEDLVYGHANYVGVAAETGHRQNIATDPACIDITSCGINASADLVSGHDRNARQVGIESCAPQDIRKINAARFDANAHLARRGLGIRRLLEDENLRWAEFCDPNLAHNSTPLAFGSLRLPKAYGRWFYGVCLERENV
jgi:hypothetical protein